MQYVQLMGGDGELLEDLGGGVGGFFEEVTEGGRGGGRGCQRQG